jgi:hypothetical protein
MLAMASCDGDAGQRSLCFPRRGGWAFHWAHLMNESGSGLTPGRPSDATRRPRTGDSPDAAAPSRQGFTPLSNPDSPEATATSRQGFSPPSNPDSPDAAATSRQGFASLSNPDSPDAAATSRQGFARLSNPDWPLTARVQPEPPGSDPHTPIRVRPAISDPAPAAQAEPEPPGSNPHTPIRVEAVRSETGEVAGTDAIIVIRSGAPRIVVPDKANVESRMTVSIYLSDEGVHGQVVAAVKQWLATADMSVDAQANQLWGRGPGV